MANKTVTFDIEQASNGFILETTADGADSINPKRSTEVFTNIDAVKVRIASLLDLHINNKVGSNGGIQLLSEGE